MNSKTMSRLAKYRRGFGFQGTSLHARSQSELPSRLRLQGYESCAIKFCNFSIQQKEDCKEKQINQVDNPTEPADNSAKLSIKSDCNAEVRLPCGDAVVKLDFLMAHSVV